MVLGDNIFYGDGFTNKLKNNNDNATNKDIATIFGYQVKDPERFGIVELDSNHHILSIEEKPSLPKSDFAITGLYFYPQGVSEYAKTVMPSKRGEIEITTLNDIYLQNNRLKAELLGGGFTWFDTGTDESLYDSISMIRSIQKNKDKVICCPEEIAYNISWIDAEKLEERANLMSKNNYGKHLKKVLTRK